MEKDIDREKFKEKKRAELEALYDAVNEETLMIAEDPEKFSAYLRVQARFNRYTVTNAILLLHQFPDAQKLKTFEGWKRDGASAKRGEKSISILEPYSYTKADGSMGKGFRIKKLFDISQTDLKQSPAPFLSGVSSRSLLRALLETSPVESEAVDALDHGKDAVYDQEKGMGSYHAEIDEEALEFLADIAGGDARNALNAIELGILTTERSADGKIHITLDVASECIQKRVVRYDKTGDNHYDTISAFIKSMRGSDPDAAVYYLAKMLYAGEDVKFIARRIMICASEDVGNADPMALQVAVAAAQAVERIGMPESQIILSQAVTYVATAPKSNAAVKAISAAMENVRNYKTTVPAHLQDAHYKGSQKLGHGVGYKYAHDYPNHYVEQQYMPSEIQKAKFYEPSDNGHEKEIKEWMEFLKKNS